MDGRVYLEVPKFSGASVPVEVAARAMRKSALYVRQGLIQGILPFGYAMKKDGSEHYDYYISPKRLWEETGFIYHG